MTILKVGTPPTNTELKEPILFFELVENSIGEVSLLVYEEGDHNPGPWFLLTIQRDGTFIRSENVGVAGISVDEEGRIRECPESRPR